MRSSIASPTITPPANSAIIVTYGDGRWEIWTAERPRCWEGNIRTVDGYQHNVKYDDRNRWRGAKGRADGVRTHFVTEHHYSGTPELAAALAAIHCGLGDRLLQLQRQRDGLFRCPHCARRYKLLGPFQDHFWGGACRDKGAQDYISGPWFEEINGRR